MKKETIVILVTLPIAIIINLILLFGLTVPTMISIKYSFKEPLTPNEFTTIMNKLDYEIENIDIPEETTFIKSLQKAYIENEYEISFVIYDTNENANNYYEYNKEYIKDLMIGKYTYKYSETEIYSKYTASSNDYYAVLIKHDNTLIYIFADKEYKNKISKTLKKLGY